MFIIFLIYLAVLGFICNMQTIQSSLHTRDLLVVAYKPLVAALRNLAPPGTKPRPPVLECGCALATRSPEKVSGQGSFKPCS